MYLAIDHFESVIPVSRKLFCIVQFRVEIHDVGYSLVPLSIKGLTAPTRSNLVTMLYLSIALARVGTKVYTPVSNEIGLEMFYWCITKVDPWVRNWMQVTGTAKILSRIVYGDTDSHISSISNELEQLFPGKHKRRGACSFYISKKTDYKVRSNTFYGELGSLGRYTRD